MPLSQYTIFVTFTLAFSGSKIGYHRFVATLRHAITECSKTSEMFRFPALRALEFRPKCIRKCKNLFAGSNESGNAVFMRLKIAFSFIAAISQLMRH